jgi:hypothetical protein
VPVTLAARINNHPRYASNAVSVNESMDVQCAVDPDIARLRSMGSVNTPVRSPTWQLPRVALPATGRHSR